MARNADYLRCLQERKNEGFFKAVRSIDVASENMRALPHDFVRSFSDKELSCKMKIRTQWGRSWEVAISKNPRFYFMEKSGWEKFVKDNALGHSEFLTFTHKGNMSFTVSIFKQNGKEMLQPSQSRASLASSSRIKTEQRRGSVYNDVKKDKVVSPELSNRGATREAESNGGEKYKRKLSFRKKKPEETQNSKRSEKVVRARRDSAASSSSSVPEFTILFKKAYLIFLRIPVSFAKDHMSEEKTMFKIHHPDGKKSWNVVYLVRFRAFSGGWRSLVKEYPIDIGDTCKFTLIEPNELLLVVFKP
ncbi:PREDICTED: B3 domain-containing protein At2g16210-like [Camelina sativa]|uniref:B3 domain-containing protein At2g16210-like n=1 Tax=Camelina sativa TaxID=90675 RepID=A0ABM0W8P9_CAMSA|nr:PREDICTED: B3 domain-containing protein At2g16210-like [Camelina sativa]